MRRREFITFVGGAVAAWPLAVRAQQSAMPVIGFMSSRSPEGYENVVAAFRRGLGEGDLIEGKNTVIEFRWALGEIQPIARTGGRTCEPPGGRARDFRRRPSGACSEGRDFDHTDRIRQH